MLLKFVLSQAAVTCAIPGSGRTEHLEDDLAAGVGHIPEPLFWRGRLDDIRA